MNFAGCAALRVSGSMRNVIPIVNGASVGSGRTAHVIVLANEKGGSGKTTTAMHVITTLLKAGQRVASIDADSRQKSLTHYVANRRRWAKKCGMPLELPNHHAIERANGPSVDENEAAEFAAFAAAVNGVENTHDFVVVDTPATDSYLMRLAHAMADTLITPLNDSFVDFDVLASIDPESYEVTGTSHYADVVREARRQRRIVEEGETDWIVMRNRVGQFETRSGRQIADGLADLSRRLEFPGCRRLFRTRDLPRAVSARAHCARYARRRRARFAGKPFASVGASGSEQSGRSRSGCRSTRTDGGAQRHGRNGSARRASRSITPNSSPSKPHGRIGRLRGTAKSPI